MYHANDDTKFIPDQLQRFLNDADFHQRIIYKPLPAQQRHPSESAHQH